MKFLLTILILALMPLSMLAQTTWYVRGLGLPSGSGTQVDPFGSIQQAIDAASNGDEVIVASGTYAESINLKGLVIKITGAAPPLLPTIISPMFPSLDVVTCNSGEGPDTVLDQLTIQGGANGILCGMDLTWTNHAAPTIKRCIINYNGLDGIRCNGTPLSSGGSIVITGCEIFGNLGSGIYLDVVPNTQLLPHVVSNSTIRDNGSYGVFCTECNLAVSRCEIRENLDHGLFCDYTQGSLESSMVWGNLGAGVKLTYQGWHTIEGCTFWSNAQGGICSDTVDTVHVRNSVVWDTLNVVCNNLFTVDYCDLLPGTQLPLICGVMGAHNIFAPPQFVSTTPGSVDLHLLPTSPCVDAGTDLFPGLPSLDIDGDPRIRSCRVDMGADERNPSHAFPYGSGEDYALSTLVNESGSGCEFSKTALPGDVLTVRILSPAGTFECEPAILAGQMFTTGGPAPVSHPGLTWLHLEMSGMVFLWGGSGYPPGGSTLPPDGVTLTGNVAPGASGHTLRLQSFVLSGSARNGIVAASDAYEIIFQ